MNKIYNKLNNRVKNDNGEANTIEMIFIMLLLIMVMITVIDAGMYFNTRYVMTNAAQNGARTAAVFGGVEPNAISKKYGITSIPANCDQSIASSVVACTVVDELKTQKQSVSGQVLRVDCGPGKTNKVGDRTYCEIDYNYRSIPGSAIGLANFSGKNTVKMTAESEVVHK